MRELSITTDRLTRNYTLSATTRGLRVEIRKDLFGSFSDNLRSAHGREFCLGRSRSEIFTAPEGSKRWGLRECFEPVCAKEQNWISFDCVYPRIYGENCRGIIQGDAVLASLSHVFDLLILSPKSAAGSKEQAQLIDQLTMGYSGKNGHDYFLGCWLGLDMVEWLSKQPNGVLKQPTQMMRSLISSVWQDANSNECCAEVYDGKLTLSVFGEATDMATYPDLPECMMSSHNVHNPAQELVLIYGLATVLDLVQGS